MKKKNKIIIILSCILLILILLFIGLVIKIIPNPFVNNRDLVCVRTEDNLTKKYMYSFNFIGRLKYIEDELLITYENVDIAKKEYNNLIKSKDNQNVNIELKDSTIIIKNNKKNTKKIDSSVFINYSRKKLKKTFQKFNYECK